MGLLVCFVLWLAFIVVWLVIVVVLLWVLVANDLFSGDFDCVGCLLIVLF